MLGTEWVAPGTGSTVRDLINAASYMIASTEIERLDAVLDQHTSLRLLEERELQSYDLERIGEALRRMQ